MNLKEPISDLKEKLPTKFLSRESGENQSNPDGESHDFVENEEESTNTHKYINEKLSSNSAVPTDSDVIKEALSRVKATRADEYKESPKSVELDIVDPGTVVNTSYDFLGLLEADILSELDRIVSLEENSVSGADIDTLVYVIIRGENNEKGVTVLGGAESLLRNACNFLECTEDEKELVLAAHEVAAERNKFDRHELLDSVAFIPRTCELPRPTQPLVRLP